MIIFGFFALVMGIVALIKVFSVDSRIDHLRREVEALKARITSLLTTEEQARAAPARPPAQSARPETPFATISQPSIMAVPVEAKKTSAPTTPVESIEPASSAQSSKRKPQEAPSPAPTPQRSLEMILGTKWLNWIGMVMLLFGIGYFMKYAYDNAWVGPKGRLSIGVLVSFVALILGERFRRRDWTLLFQVFTGGALAALYLCVYFSFQVYHLSGQGIASLLAVLVTAFAVALAVVYDAIAVEILALAGGFLSPVLLSTGENHPYAFFTYIAVLNLVAIATSVYRRWRLIDLLCLLGTVIMYTGWVIKFYAPDQMQPALIFTSLFYLMFLLIPTIHGLVNRLAQDAQGMMMILAACVLSFVSYFSILYPAYRYTLGFITIAQALFVFLLFYIWVKRVGVSGATGASLLSIALGLVTTAIPIQLELYGIPVAWAMEGVVLTYVGMRLKHHIPRIAGFVALGLSVICLFSRLPLHSQAFTPLLNTAFCSWLFVVAMFCSAAYFWWGYETGSSKKEDETVSRPKATLILALIGLGFFTILLNVEVFQFWQYDYLGRDHRFYQSACLLVLWIVFSTAVAFIITRKVKQGWNKDWLTVSVIYYCGGLIAFVFCLLTFFEGVNHRPPFVNIGFASSLVFILSLAYGGQLWRRVWQRVAGDVMESTAHALLAILLALELTRWGSISALVTQKMSTNLVSVVWAFQAFSLILIGLAKNRPLLRYLGFVLFAVTIAKVLLIDTSELEKVYRIVSFIGCGLLLVAAGYFYQRYSAKLVERQDLEKTE
jgi:uncharacterized membrane protein